MIQEWAQLAWAHKSVFKSFLLLAWTYTCLIQPHLPWKNDAILKAHKTLGFATDTGQPAGLKPGYIIPVRPRLGDFDPEVATVHNPISYFFNIILHELPMSYFVLIRLAY